MSFLSPMFLAGVAAAAVPILLHLLRRQPEARVKFPAMRLLRHAPVEQMSRRRLRELLLLALRVGVLVLLSLAFARPFLVGSAAPASGGVTVIALDTSLSLSAPARMAQARSLARQAVDAAPSGHLVGVITFDDAATVTAEPAADRGLAVAAVDAADAGAGATRYRAALESAIGLIAAHGDGTGRIVVVTDLQARGWDEGDRVRLPGQVQVDVADVGPLPDNLAVVNARVEGDRRVVATVANFGAGAREARVVAMTDGRQAGDATVTVGGGQSADVALDDVDGEGVVLAVDDPDGLQADNVRYLVMERAGPPPVLVVTATGDLGREAFYVEQALAASGGRGAAFSVEGVAASALSSWDEARLDRFAAIIVTSTRGLERRGRELLGGLGERRGGILLVAGPGVDGDVAAEVLGADVSIVVPASTDPRDPRGAGRALVPIDARHPVFQAIGTAGASLGGTTFQRVAEVRSAECETIARFTTGEPALVDCSRGGGRTLVFASDLDHGWNDLPRHASFVPFVHEAVRYLSAGHGDVEALIVGQTPLAARPGFVSRPDRGGAERVVAVNPDPRESEPARLAPEAFHEGLAEAADALPAAVVEARQQEDRQHIWRYALLAMIAMLMVESVVASRAV